MTSNKHILILLFAAVFSLGSFAKTPPKVYQLESPNKQIQLQVSLGEQMFWSVVQAGDTIIAPSLLSIKLANGSIWGLNAKVESAKIISVDAEIKTINYRKNTVRDNYNQLTINCKGNYGIIFRVYNDGACYRFFSTAKEGVVIADEEANFNFKSDYKAWIPYTRDYRENQNMQIAFESSYDYIHLSEYKADSLAILPLLVDMGNQKKALIMETDIEDYPGMFININKQTKKGFQGVFPKYPEKERVGGFMELNYMVDKRFDYIAKSTTARSLPWRVVYITTNDKQLADNDMSQRLAAPSRIADPSWIKPGKVAWDWWNDWNITHVDFRAGINTPTYKYYIDFASEYGVEYVVLDEGWYKGHNVLEMSDAIDLKEILSYAKSKNVGIILWASWHAFDVVKEQAFKKYSEMGVKGFKVDFFDRDDQKAMRSCYELAEMAAGYKMLMDYHGMMPSGIQRTWPNVLNFEGVKGMENVKWTPNDDVPLFDVTVPFLRMMAGPMDYTPGAMRNSIKSDFRPSNSSPMSQGTRCHQLAMYVVFEAPLQMMADNPTAYKRESECAHFIAKVPTTFDQTIVLDAKVSEYIATARRKGDNWYIGAMSNWNSRSLTLDLSFLPDGEYQAEIFADGINADRDATDYKRETKILSKTDKLTINLSNGGGYALRLEKVKK